ncbi:putative PB1 domain-containing protein [Tanacetum coccineum]
MVGPTLNAPKPPMIKFLCSYGGRILPRYPDGKLRYHGGHTRVLAVVRSVEFSELMTKLEELCGKPVTLRCQLPTEDLDALVTITSDEDLMNLIEEYDRTPCPHSSSIKIRAFLSLPKQKSPPKLPLQSRSTASGSGSGSAGSGSGSGSVSPKSPSPSFSAQRMTGDGVLNRCVYTSAKPPLSGTLSMPLSYNKSGAKMPYYGYRNPNTNNRIYLVHNGNHWQ